MENKYKIHALTSYTIHVSYFLLGVFPGRITHSLIGRLMVRIPAEQKKICRGWHCLVGSFQIPVGDGLLTVCAAENLQIHELFLKVTNFVTNSFSNSWILLLVLVRICCLRGSDAGLL